MSWHAPLTGFQINHDVRPDSMLILHAARAVCTEEGFDELLEGVRDRIDEIESLHRTRELTVSFRLHLSSFSYSACVLSLKIWKRVTRSNFRWTSMVLCPVSRVASTGMMTMNRLYMDYLSWMF